jgi:glycosyltransferase involved in cell wall biosynthesis
MPSDPPSDSPDAPALSVVVVAGERRARVEGSLRSVLRQEVSEPLEIVVVDCARAAAAPYLPEVDPLRSVRSVRSVRTVRPGGRVHYGEALAIGARAARAPIVAFLEEHARAHDGWAEAVLSALRDTSCAGIACEVHSGNPGLGLSDGWGLMGYGRWYAPLPEGSTDFLHGYNAAFQRSVLLSYGERLGDLLLADTAFARRLLLDGYTLRNAPEARIDHLNEIALLEPLRKAYLAHRFSAPARARECGWSPLVRLVYALGTPLLPLYGLWCQAPFLRRRDPALWKTLVRILPLFLLNHLVIGLGASVGLLFGPGDAALRFTALELNTDRPQPSAGAA